MRCRRSQSSPSATSTTTDRALRRLELAQVHGDRHEAEAERLIEHPRRSVEPVAAGAHAHDVDLRLSHRSYRMLAERAPEAAPARRVANREHLDVAMSAAGVDAPGDEAGDLGRVTLGYGDVLALGGIVQSGDVASIVVGPRTVLMLEHGRRDHGAEALLVERPEDLDGQVDDVRQVVIAKRANIHGDCSLG